jgi:orotidine-5'-phosphate decarboxylase
MTNNWAEKIAIAIDVPDFDSARKLMDQLDDSVRLFKVGSQLFTSVGPAIIKEIKDRGKNIFLDLKFHDIPNTVAKASEVATELGVDIFNVHISGGSEMMATTAKAVKSKASELGIKKPIVLGVTVLTSIDEAMFHSVFGTTRDLASQIIHMAELAKNSGLDGVVASPQEIKILRKTFGDDFVILTPGVRAEKLLNDDQKRIMTPSQALSDGADYLVIGRPIYQSPDPAKTFAQILQQIELDYHI